MTPRPLSGAPTLQKAGGRATFLSKGDRNVRSPLAAIGKAVTAPYRILQVGTSIASQTWSPNHRLVQWLKNFYGDSGMTRLQAGQLGGSNNNAVNGWLKQPYGGVYYLRSKGTSTSTAITNILNGYGDQVVIEWSQESDTGSTEVLVDGVSAGFFGTSGAQKYGQQTVFTVTRGAHTVTINPPASGSCYLEAVEIRDSARRGVEAIDGTLGGSSLSMAVGVGTATGSQTAGIAITPGAGINALFGRTDVDLIIMSFTVNDAGANPGDPTAADYRAYLEQAVMTAKKRNVPVVLIIEPAGHYSMPNDAGSTANHLRYEAVKAHQLAVDAAFDHVFVADWDTASRIPDPVQYAATYYPAVSAINLAAGTFTGDWIHPDGTIANPIHESGTKALADVLGLTGSLGTARTALEIELSALQGVNATIRPLSLGTNNAFARTVDALYRITTATNLRPALNTSITASGTSDANGKYFLASNYNWSMGTIAGQNMVVMKIGPNDSGLWSIQGGDTGVHFYDPNGVEMGASLSSRQFQMSGLTAGTATFIAFAVSQDANNKNLLINGRVYEAVITANTVPVVGTAP